MNTKTFVMALAMGSLMVGCKSDKGDSAETGATNACGDDGSDGTDGTDGGASIDSCDWTGLDLCFEYSDYSGTEAWCGDMAATYGIDTSYNAAECPSGAVGQCSVPAQGDIPSDSSGATAYYYSPSFDADTAASACADAGGS